MTIRIIETNGKHQPTTYCINPDNLNASNPVDATILKELKRVSKRKTIQDCYIHFDVRASDIEDGEPADVSAEAKIHDDDQILWVKMDYNA